MNKLKLSLSVLFVLALSLAVFGLQPRTQEAVTIFSDKATFLSATCAKSATGPLPLLGYVSSAKVGSLTISNVSGSSDPSGALGFGVIDRLNPKDFWTTLLPGIDLAVGGFEDLNIVLDTPSNAFGFDFAEHMTIPSEEGSLCSGTAACVDSIFTVTLFLDDTLVDSFLFNAPNDVASFVGVSSAAAFNRVEIRESRTQGGIENDYYGEFYVGDSCIPECVSPPPSMVSWWPGDGNANDIQGGNNGMLVNGVTFAPGIVGQAFSLGGPDDIVRVPHNSGLNVGMGDFTIDAWIRFTDPSFANDRIIISKFSPIAPFPGYTFRWLGNEFGANLQFIIDSELGGFGSSVQDKKVEATITRDTHWHHVAAVRRGLSMELYYDGMLVATAAHTSLEDADNNGSLGIGNNVGAPDNGFPGLIDEPEIFNRALSAAEIQSIFHAGSAGKCKNRAPAAICQDVTVTSDLDGTAAASIDNGSFDPDGGDAITLTQSPPGPYPIGQTTVTLTVEDNHGASSSCQGAVTVLYNFSGFFPPVNNPPTLNLVNAGAAIPVKFSLNGNKGLNIFAAGYPVSQQITCSDGAPVSDIEETVTAGNSSISYDATTDQYTYVWKTDKSWKGTCRQLIFKLNDNSFRVANFQFR